MNRNRNAYKNQENQQQQQQQTLQARKRTELRSAAHEATLIHALSADVIMSTNWASPNQGERERERKHYNGRAGRVAPSCGGVDSRQNRSCKHVVAGLQEQRSPSRMYVSAVNKCQKKIKNKLPRFFLLLNLNSNTGETLKTFHHPSPKPHLMAKAPR